MSRHLPLLAPRTEQKCLPSPAIPICRYTLVDGVIGVGGRVHISAVDSGAGDGDVGVIEGAHVGGAVDVNLAAFGGVDLVEAEDRGDAGAVALIGADGGGIGRGVEHGYASELHAGSGFGLLIPNALVALGGTDPQGVVVGKDHAVMGAVADGVGAGD